MVPKIGGTKKFDFEKIDKIRPDLVLGNKEENYLAGVARLREKYPVWVSDIATVDDAFRMMQSVGEMTETAEPVAALIEEIEAVRRDAETTEDSPRIAYFIWQKPLMVAGGGTFIHAMMQEAGFSNVFEGEIRYPEVTPEEVSAARPEFIFLSSEPFPFTDRHQASFEKTFPDARVVLVDGALFSWYGSRLVQAFPYLRALKERLRTA